MSQVTEKTGTGVIVARMQVSQLTGGHKYLIEHSLKHNKNTIVLLGVNRLGMPSTNNPLSFEARAFMIHENFSNVIIKALKDVKSDEDWSNSLDEIISSTVPNDDPCSITLYGSRDSFLNYYSGKYNRSYVEPVESFSGTHHRALVKEIATQSSQAFREGVIWATQNKHPVTYPVVDAAVIDTEKGLILLGKKPGEKLWRFPGGFVDPNNSYGANALENTVKREVIEETGVVVDGITYVGSFYCEDGRYNGEVDCMMTTLFIAKYKEGTAIAGDDLDQVDWFHLDESIVDLIGPPTHVKMFNVLLNNIKGN